MADRMPKLPIAIGSYAEQKRFIERNDSFLREYPRLNDLCKKIFLRALKGPDRREVERLRKLPEADPAAIAFEDKMTADRIIFYLGRMAVDDFGEILTLAGNGRGFGAYKIVRGMYERIVTALYMEKNPAEARSFAESSAIMKLNYLKRTFEASPESGTGSATSSWRRLSVMRQRRRPNGNNRYALNAASPSRRRRGLG